jgi:hypothetical protein
MNLAQGLVPPLDPDPIHDLQPPEPSWTPVQIANMACDRAYGPVLSHLFGLGRSLAQGITLSDYGDKVTATNDDLQKVDTKGLDVACMASIGFTVNSALGHHIDAWVAWQDCIAKHTTEAKFDACFEKTVNAVWSGRLTDDYTQLFDAMGKLYLNQVTLMPLF